MRITQLALLTCLPAMAAGFRAAAVKVDITPQTSQWLMGYAARKSTGVHDPIYHRVVAMDAGDAQFYLVSSDLCLFSPEVYDEVARDLEREAGIPRAQLWWSVTHTHAAPEVGPPGIYKALLGRSDHEWDREYAALVKDSLVRAVKEARGKLEPARIAFGQGIAMANINRRAKDVDGKISLGLNPDGPVDRQIGLMRLERPDGSLIALVANYAMHGTVMSGQNLLISGDGPGTVTAYVEQKMGAPVLYVNGAAGNIAPIYSVYADAKSGHLSQFGVLLGDRILAAARSMGPATGDVTMVVGETAIATPQKEGLVWPDELRNYSAQSGRPMVRLPVRFLRINDIVIWAAPVELFCEIAMAVRERSPFTHTFYFGYTNGWLGYLPTAQAFAEGGYEPNTSPFTAQAEADVMQGVISLVQGMRK
jgi:neutral ceramidase